MISRYCCLLSLVVLTLLADRASAQDGWWLFRGNPERTGGTTNPGAFKEKTAWQRPLLLDKIEGFDEPEPDKAVKAIIDRLRQGADPTILPGFFPVVAGELCLYRTHRDVRCITMQALKMGEGKDVMLIKPGEIFWMGVPFSTTLANWADNPRSRAALDTLETLLTKANHKHSLWTNPMTGALSTDGTYLYAIEDMPVPGVPDKGNIKAPELREAALRNALAAFNVSHGKLEWDISQRDADPAFADSFFLGAPLALNRKLYVLNEKAGEVRLMTIDLDRKQWKKLASPPLDKMLKLTKVPNAEQIQVQLVRRTQPLHLAHAEGLLVCPTHASVIVGVDLAKLTIRWTFRYRDEKAAAPAQPHWQAASPIIHKEGILFTAPDSPQIHCIGLDGKKKWSVPSDKDLYLATAHDDIVLLVGKGQCRALSLADGKEKWKVETGPPAGVGVKDGSVYYVPLQRDAVNEGPTIWGIDLKEGKKTRRVQVQRAESLGNLVLVRGMVISQSATHIAAFPLAVLKP